KLENALGGLRPALASPEEAERIAGVPMGFVTPVGTKVKVLADLAIGRMESGVVGAGEADYHLANAKPGRDFVVGEYHDLAEAIEGDPCPRCGSPTTMKRGLEIGRLAKLGTRVAEAMGATVMKGDGHEGPVVVGGYSISLSVALAAAVEQNHDQDGIIWPMALAPFQVALLSLQPQKAEVREATDKLFSQLTDLGVETMLDDRDERPGVKFKDADLLGFPLRVTVSEKGLAQGQLELKNRRSREVTMLPLGQVSQALKNARDKALGRAG
ncbi:MAG: proline--tRNA ligase, partial [Deltaproteobacteria bacterium]|nr:proline--tRNA ligase [Deltaproteobacteria bacterium]